MITHEELEQIVEKRIREILSEDSELGQKLRTLINTDRDGAGTQLHESSFDTQSNNTKIEVA